MDDHPWRDIGLEVYESHMSDDAVGQLQRLHEITRAQLADNPAHTIGILGIAGGNGLDLVDPDTVDSVYGYDINPDYLKACRARYDDLLGERLHLTECSIDRTLRIPPVDLLIANLIIEYVGLGEFVAFVAANSLAIGVLSCVTQQNGTAGIVSTTQHSSSFDGLESIASEIRPAALQAALSTHGWTCTVSITHVLPNDKTLTRQDFIRVH